ncbi:MAG: folate-binding protein YgfZ [Solirubrobacterales bacterium]|nr:folate-binding protein YgfZ [Solirubrobacterales bacterium]
MDATLEIDAQYRAIREEAGLLDRSRRPRILVTGSEAAEFLQGQVTNDVEALEPGAGCYAALLDRKGKIRADMRILRLSADEFLIDTEPETGDPLRGHLSMYKVGRDAEVATDDSGDALISLLGPRAVALTGERAPGAEHCHDERLVAGARCRAIATDAGIDLLVPADAAEAVVSHLLGEGAQPIGEEAAEIARVESGRPRVGREIGPQTMPAEAAIADRAVSFTKGCYIGQETVARLHYKGKPNRHLRRLRPASPVSAGDPVRAGDRDLGVVGTAVISPAEGPLALAILRREAEPGAEVEVGDGIAAVVETIGD